MKGARRLGRTHHKARSSSNSHLHIALAVAIVASSAIAIVIPIARTPGGGEEAGGLALLQGNDGLSEALRAQAASITVALASAPSGQNAGDARLTPPLGSGLVPKPLLAEAAKLATSGIYPTPGTRSALVMTRPFAVRFTVHEDGFTSTYSSAHITVGQALASEGIAIGEGDWVAPPPQSELTAGAHIYIHHAAAVRLLVGGVEQQIKTRSQSVGDVLAEAGVQLAEKDRVTPRLARSVSPNMTIRVTTVRDHVDIVEEPIQYESLIEYDAELPRDERVVSEGGEYGWIRREYRVRVVNGRETRRALVDETYTPPKDEVITVGTYVPPAATAAPAVVPTPAVAAAVATPQADPACSRTLNVYATWYTASSAGGSGITATGTTVHKGIVAVDPAVIPLGTRMYIPGYGYGIAADTGGSIIGNIIDLGYGPNDVYDWRSRWVDICIL